MTEDLKYPLGKYAPMSYEESRKQQRLLEIKNLPTDLENALLNLDHAQLQTPYRPEGWTVHQLVHHIADSHLNAYCRFKLGLTEDRPTIKPYEEKLWAQLRDVQVLPVNISLTLLHALHARWYAALQDLSDAEWQREVIHPEHGKSMSLWYLLGLYAWHGKHHVAHINKLRSTMGW